MAETSKYFLQVEGGMSGRVDGGSRHPAHWGWIPIDAWAWTGMMANPNGVGGAQAQPGARPLPLSEAASFTLAGGLPGGAVGRLAHLSGSGELCSGRLDVLLPSGWSVQWFTFRDAVVDNVQFGRVLSFSLSFGKLEISQVSDAAQAWLRK
jgi:hypothetical protein